MNSAQRVISMAYGTRRRFITTALGVGAGAALYSALPALAKVSFNPDEETEVRKSAKHTMVFGSPYLSDEWKSSPHMHSYLKKNIQEMSKGQIYVDIRDGGELGIGTELMVKVSRGQISAALVSASNLSPVAPELDILNIPFWSAGNQAYVNLVTSQTWENLIIDKVRAQGRIDVLFHYLPGPRTATTTKIYGRTIRTPADIKDVLFRIPPSESLRKYR